MPDQNNTAKSDFLKEIIDSAVDGIITIDNRGKIESANPAAQKFFGYTEAEMLGNGVHMLMPEPDHSLHNSYIDNYKKTGIGGIIGKGREVKGKRKDGTTFPFLLSISEININGKQMFTGIIHDISELKKVQDALRKEKELNELKSRFVTMASHEFRTPLSTILSSVSLIAKYPDKKDQEKRDKHIQRIKSSVENLTSVLNDFLSLSRLEEGRILLTPVELNLRDLSEDVVDEMNSMTKTGQTIVHKCVDCNSILKLDKNVLKNIITNLLSNAIKYSPEHSIITMESSIEKSVISISVTDQGIGIPDEDKPHIYSRFFRAHNAGNIQGTGLGLNIVKKYLDLMNGNITFKSTQNQGTTFTVFIPIQ
jgi:two-component system, LuxR family, sensor kinase FixL